MSFIKRMRSLLDILAMEKVVLFLEKKLKKWTLPNAITLSQSFCLAQVGGELANPNITGPVGVRKLTTNLQQAGKST